VKENTIPVKIAICGEQQLRAMSDFDRYVASLEAKRRRVRG